jgi:exopolyphosphatase/guanosine-5'-triphosphate,3'-diphosphate pyrophosphatase
MTELPKRTIAAIDVGSNSAHMVIAEMDHAGEMRILDTDKVTLRLGQTLSDDLEIPADAVRRTTEALAHMREIIAPYKATIRAVATHAIREARNGKQIIRDIAKATGIRVEIIDGIEEARLSFLGMRYGLMLNGVSCLGVDVGGGSTEIIIARDDDIAYVASLKLGAVTLTERYFGRRGYGAGALDGLVEHVRSRIAPIVPEARRADFGRALASSGTAKALAYLHARLFEGVEIGDANGYVLPREGLFAIEERLGKLMTPAKIKEATGLDTARAEIILAGTVVLAEMTRAFEIGEWIVTGFGLREGIVADTFYRFYGERAAELPDIQWHSVLQFAKRLGLNEGHALHVKRLALSLYEQLWPMLRPDDSDEDHDANVKLLKATAYLREAGKFVSTPQYHRHSQYILTNCRLPGFTEGERQFMGLVARFHRKGTPAVDHEECRELGEEDVERLALLAGIVRLAAALDRTRQQRVREVEVFGEGHEAEIVLWQASDAPADVELHKARLEQSALEKCLGLELKFTARSRPPRAGERTP